MPSGMALATRSEAASHHGRSLWSSTKGRRLLRPAATRARQPTQGRAPLPPLTCNHNHGREPLNHRSRERTSWPCGHAARLRDRKVSATGEILQARQLPAKKCTMEARGKVMPTDPPLFSLCEVARRSAAICSSSDGSNLPGPPAPGSRPGRALGGTVQPPWRPRIPDLPPAARGVRPSLDGRTAGPAGGARVAPLGRL